MKILIVNGPNLNMLGKREPEIYGSRTFGEFFGELQFHFADIELASFQSNSEGEIIDKLQQTMGGDFHGVVINPAAYTHTSIAIADAIAAMSIPVVEVHISNIMDREEFRHTSYVSRHAVGTITGFGLLGYQLAIQGLKEMLES